MSTANVERSLAPNTLSMDPSFFLNGLTSVLA